MWIYLYSQSEKMQTRYIKHKSMKLLSVIALASAGVSAQDVLTDPAALGAAAADAIAGDAELDALLNQYQASAPPARGAAAFGRSGGGFDMQALLGGRQLPPGMNLMDFITPQDRSRITFGFIGFRN